VELEQGVSLSHSHVWKLQENAYKQYGMNAWATEGVPQFPTSNPWTAIRAARLVAAYLEKAKAAECPIVWDLGAGSGRFAYLFLQAYRGPPIRYIMTDIVPANVEFWKNNAQLRPYFEAGILEARLQEARAPFEFSSIAVAFAHYFFDTIPQDYYRVEKGQLQEGKITLTTPHEVIDREDPRLIPSLSLTAHFEPAAHPLLTAAQLEEWEGHAFFYPTYALQVLDHLYDATSGHFLLLAGDQGTPIPATLPLDMAKHGTFSTAVAYPLIADWFQQKGGEVWLNPYAGETFVPFIGLFQGTSKTWENIERDFVSFDMSDFLALLLWMKEPPFPLFLRLLKCAHHDPVVLLTHFEQIRQALSTATEREKNQLRDMLPLVYQYCYPLGPVDGEAIMNIGVIAYELGDLKQARAFFLMAQPFLSTDMRLQHNLKLTETTLHL